MKSKLLLFGAAVCNQFVAAIDFYVSLNGSDNNTGTLAATAVQTLPKAQQIVCKQIASAITKNVTVYISLGTYTLSVLFTLIADDSRKNGFIVRSLVEHVISF